MRMTTRLVRALAQNVERIAQLPRLQRSTLLLGVNLRRIDPLPQPIQPNAQPRRPRARGTGATPAAAAAASASRIVRHGAGVVGHGRGGRREAEGDAAELCGAEDVGEGGGLEGGVGEGLQLFGEGRAFEQGDALGVLGVAAVGGEEAGVAVVGGAAEQYVVAVEGGDDEFEVLCGWRGVSCDLWKMWPWH